MNAANWIEIVVGLMAVFGAVSAILASVQKAARASYAQERELAHLRATLLQQGEALSDMMDELTSISRSVERLLDKDF